MNSLCKYIFLLIILFLNSTYIFPMEKEDDGKKSPRKKQVKMEEPKDKTIFDAIRENKLEVVENQFLSKELINLEGEDGNGDTPLVLATKLGHEPIIKALVDRGARVNHFVKNYSPLHYAALYGHDLLIAFFLTRPFNNAQIFDHSTNKKDFLDVNMKNVLHETPLMCACKEGQLSAIKCLLFFGADPMNKNKKSEDAFNIARQYQYKKLDEALNLLKKEEVEKQDIARTYWDKKFSEMLIILQKERREAIEIEETNTCSLCNQKIEFEQAYDLNAPSCCKKFMCKKCVNTREKEVTAMEALLEETSSAKSARVDLYKLLKPCPTCNKPFIVLKSIFKCKDIFEAIHANNKTAVRRFLNQDSINLEEMDKDNYTPLLRATELDYKSLVKVLVYRRKDYKGNRHFAKADHPIEKGNAAIHYAAKWGRDDIIRCLAFKGASNFELKNANNDTPLMLACRAGNLSSVKILLDWGADPTHTNRDDDDAFDFAGKSKKNSEEILNELAKAKAAKLNNELFWSEKNKKKKKVGNLEIHVATLSGNRERIKFITDDKTKMINCQNGKGETPLMLACKKCDIEIIKFLLQLNADPRIKNFKDKSCLRIAKKSRSKEEYSQIRQLLLTKARTLFLKEEWEKEKARGWDEPENEEEKKTQESIKTLSPGKETLELIKALSSRKEKEKGQESNEKEKPS